MTNDENYPIDIVIPWVDGSDPAWLKERNEYANKLRLSSTEDNTEARFRDWGTLKYVFRSIELYAPWVNKIHLITWGHLPTWININVEKLNIVNHRDYIPEEYLPTFSSHTIELNMHRIRGLSDHFIYFNDDILLLRPTHRKDFFVKGLPRDYAILNVISSSHRGSVMDTALTDIEVINDHFEKNKVIRQNLLKWINIKYGRELFRTALLMPWPHFLTLHGTHNCNSYLKSTFEKVWNCEYKLLDNTCKHNFRTRRDANQWLMREWQLCEGNFIPSSPNKSLNLSLKNDNTGIEKVLRRGKLLSVCINDNGAEEIIDFDKTSKELIEVLDDIFPEKSSFEK